MLYSHRLSELFNACYTAAAREGVRVPLRHSDWGQDMAHPCPNPLGDTLCVSRSNGSRMSGVSRTHTHTKTAWRRLPHTDTSQTDLQHMSQSAEYFVTMGGNALLLLCHLFQHAGKNTTSSRATICLQPTVRTGYEPCGCNEGAVSACQWLRGVSGLL